MRWLIVLPFDRPHLMGVDMRDELSAMGHEVKTFAYRRENVLYKNRGTKALYQRWLLRSLERFCRRWRPELVLVVKGGPIAPETIRHIREKTGALVLNFFPDNPLHMIPFECIEAYDVFFTKERYAIRSLQQAGLENLHYLPMYCVPSEHYPVALTDEESKEFAAPVSFVGSHYPYRERFLSEMADYPLKIWGGGWHRARDARVRRLVAGGTVWGRKKLCIYSGSTLSLNQHHPLNDIVGVNTRAFELAASGACQVVDLKEDLSALFKPGEEVVAYRDLADLKRHLDYYLAHPDEARAIGENALKRALAEHTLRHRLEEMLVVVQRQFRGNP
jgi:spore maturation protein CgeB